MMERKPEPELMEDEAQALAYARADFEEAHGSLVDHFRRVLPPTLTPETMVDLGCGPGDVTLRFARLFPDLRIIAVDGSEAMVALGREAAAREGLADRVRFEVARIDSSPVPDGSCDLVVATSVLHHLSDPAILWEGVRRAGHDGSFVYVADLRRPGSESEARTIVEEGSREEPEVLQRDFYHSLLAAYATGEVRRQLREAGLDELSVQELGDRHLVAHGVLAPGVGPRTS